MSPVGTLERLRGNGGISGTVLSPVPAIRKIEAPRPVSELGPIISTLYTAQSGTVEEWPYYKLVNAYKSWVYTCIDKIAKAVAMIPIRLFVYRGQKSGKLINPHDWRAVYKALKTKGDRMYFLKEHGVEREEITEHPFLDLVHKPNGHMTRFDLWYHTMVRLELGGKCGWLKVRDKALNMTREIWPLPLMKHARISPKVAPNLTLEYWNYEDGNIRKQFKPEDVFMMKYPHPASPFEGMSPLMAQSYPYDIDLFLMQQQRALFEHGAVPGLHLTTDQMLTPEQVEDIKEQIAEQYGGPLKSGETLVTHSGFKANKLGQTGRDIMLGVLNEMIQDRLITAFDLSPGKVGLVKDVNRANGEFLDETFLKECLKPKCMLIEESIETFLLPEFDERLTCDFDLPDYGDKDYKLRERTANLTLMYTTINQEREKDGLEPVPWGEKPWTSFSMVQAGEGALPTDEEDGKSFRRSKSMGPGFWTAEKKDVYWKMFVRRSEYLEGSFLRPLKKYFNRVEREVLQRLDNEGDKVSGTYAGWSRQKVVSHIKGNKAVDEINIEKEKEKAELVRTFTPVVKTIMKEVGDARIKNLRESVGKAGNIAVAFNVDDPKAKKWLGDKMKRFSEEVTGTSFDEISKVLRRGFADGLPLTEIAEELSEMFESWDKYRAPLIARTETISAMNRSDLEAVRQVGLEEKLLKCWLTAGDERVRDSHIEAGETYSESQGIPIDDLFEVGGDRMEAPAGGRRPEENVNCRCTLFYTEVPAEEEEEE